AWEPDFVELPDGALLFINSTVQGGRAVRQIVRKSSTGWVNGPLMEIHRGAPDDWEKNKQGGFTPESVTMTPAGLIVGARRGGVYSCSNDLGENWYEIEGPAKCNYQPIIENLPDGKFLAVWHYGGDTRFGEIDMFIGTHEFELEANLSLPLPTVLTLERELSEDRTQYISSFSARLTADGKAVAGREIQLQVRDVWVFDPKRRMNPVNVWDSPDIRIGITNSGGVARFELKDKVRIPDIHHCYQVGVSFVPASGEKLAGCKGPARPAYSLTQARNNSAPYPIYNLGGRIMITPATREKFPDLVDIVKHFCVPDPSAGIDTWIKASGSEKRAKEVLGFLMKYHIVHSDEKGVYHWYRAIGSIPGPEELKPGMQYIHGVEVCTLEEYCV
ncbi:MAG: hypothetical protein KAQ69_13715, partial [Spirochaetales bacterium]|nr:hypothetical protein [Spirochaetales bacterium]